MKINKTSGKSTDKIPLLLPLLLYYIFFSSSSFHESLLFFFVQSQVSTVVDGLQHLAVTSDASAVKSTVKVSKAQRRRVSLVFVRHSPAFTAEHVHDILFTNSAVNA